MDRHYHVVDLFRNRELNELYVSIAIKSFALSMINIFVPIFLIKFGYPLKEVLLFFIFMTFIHGCCTAPAAKFAAKFGLKHMMFFSVPMLIIFYLLLYSLDVYGWSLYLIAFFGGLHLAFFWTAYHIHFSVFSKKKIRGSQVSFAYIFRAFFYVTGPLLGGFILKIFDFKVLFIIVGLVLFVSTFPLFLSKDVHKPVIFSVKRILTAQKPRDVVALLAYGVEYGLSSVVWPIFIFFTILNDFTLLGFVTSLLIFFSIISVYFIGRYSDVSRRFVLRIGAIFNSMIWFVKVFVRTIVQVLMIDTFYGIAKGFINVPFDALCYDKANKSNVVEYIIFREIVIQLGRIFLFVIVIFFDDLTLSFAVGGITSLLYLLF